MLIVFAISACSSPDPTFYTLHTTPGAAHAVPPQVIEVRRPGLAGYLDRSDLVLKDAGYKLNLNSQQRWAEPLGDMIGRVLTEDLGQRLPGSSVFSESGAITADPGLRVEVDVDRFDASEDGAVQLVAGVAIEAGISHKPLRTHTVMLTAVPSAPDGAALAATMSGLLGQLADQVAQDIASLGPVLAASR